MAHFALSPSLDNKQILRQMGLCVKMSYAAVKMARK